MFSDCSACCAGAFFVWVFIQRSGGFDFGERELCKVMGKCAVDRDRVFVGVVSSV